MVKADSMELPINGLSQLANNINVGCTNANPKISNNNIQTGKAISFLMGIHLH